MTHVFPKETFTFWQFSVGLWGVCPAYFLSKQMAHDAMLLPVIQFSKSTCQIECFNPKLLKKAVD